MVFATTTSVFNLLLAGLSLAAKALLLVTCMPLLLVFSPILVPAGITATVLAAAPPAAAPPAGDTPGASPLTMFFWIFKQIMGKNHSQMPAGDASATATPGDAVSDGSAPSAGGAPPGGDASLASMKIAANPTTKSKPKPTAKSKTKPAVAKPKAKLNAKSAAKPKAKAKPAAKKKK